MSSLYCRLAPLQLFSDLVRITFDCTETLVTAEGNKHTVAFFQPFEHAVVELFNQVLVFGAVDEVVHFFRVVSQVVEFINVPDTMIVDVFVAIGTDAMGSWGMGEVTFPVVFIEGAVTPGGLFALQDGQEGLSVHTFGGIEAGYIHYGWGDVDVLDELFNN